MLWLGERKDWIIHSPPYSVTHVICETRDAQLHVICTCVKHVCVLVGELGSSGPGSGHYGLIDPPGQDTAPEWPVPSPAGPYSVTQPFITHSESVSNALSDKDSPGPLSGWAGPSASRL